MLNPTERFVILSMTRENIADMCNDRISVMCMNIAEFTSGDDRLTHRLCGEVVDQIAEIYDTGLDEEERGEAERDTIDAFLRKHFL